MGPVIASPARIMSPLTLKMLMANRVQASSGLTAGGTGNTVPN